MISFLSNGMHLYFCETIYDANLIHAVHRNPKWTSVETGTNPIDRTVAHLLFHRPSELLTRAVKEEIPQSPALYNPGKVVFNLST